MLIMDSVNYDNFHRNKADFLFACIDKAKLHRRFRIEILNSYKALQLHPAH